MEELEAMKRRRRVIREGDVVVVYNGHSSVSHVQVECGGVLHHRFGDFALDEWIGRTYGSCVAPSKPVKHSRKRAKTGKFDGERRFVRGGAVTLLEPRPEIWSKALDRRTQITYSADNALIVAHLHLKPGDLVIESGTGSGCLTTFLARAVGPTGKVMSFEANENRFEAAKKDFERLRLDNIIICTYADVYKDGFGEDLTGKADAVFLDLPAPLNALEHARKSLKRMGRICCFTPSIEQAQRCKEFLSEHNFLWINTVECLLQEFRVHLQRVIEPVFDRKSQDEDQGGEKKEKEGDEVGVTPHGHIIFPEHLSKIQHKGVQNVLKTAEQFDRIPGHTGYLTFAFAPFDP